MILLVRYYSVRYDSIKKVNYLTMLKLYWKEKIDWLTIMISGVKGKKEYDNI